MAKTLREAMESTARCMLHYYNTSPFKGWCATAQEAMSPKNIDAWWPTPADALQAHTGELVVMDDEEARIVAEIEAKCSAGSRIFSCEFGTCFAPHEWLRPFSSEDRCIREVVDVDAAAS